MAPRRARRDIGFLRCIRWYPLGILALVVRPSVCVCLVPSPSSTSHICFDENNQTTDPNIANHRLDLAEESDDLSEGNVFPFQAKRNDTSSYLSAESRRKVSSLLSLPNESDESPRRKSSPSRSKLKEAHYYTTGSSERVRNEQLKSPTFIPVAAYSITKRNPKRKKPSLSQSDRHRMSASTVSVHRKRPTGVQYSEDISDDEPEDEEESDDEYEMRKESAVYGYIHKPEVIEFRGQYYYGQNEQNKYQKQPLEYDSHESVAPMVHEPHRVSYMETYEEPSASEILLAKLKKVLLVKGITAKGLLLASLPLMLTPVLSYFLTPVVIPVTATVAAGRRRKRHTNESDTGWMAVNGTMHSPSSMRKSVARDIPEKKLLEAKIMLEYLNKVKPDERLATSAVASFLECDGLFLPSDRCLEQLSCEFSDVQNVDAVQLERAVTSIIISHLLNNEFISKKFKKRLKRAAVYGRMHSGECKSKYPCQRVMLNQIHGRRRPKS